MSTRQHTKGNQAGRTSTSLTANSINAERFVPQHKQRQWDSTPRIILVAAPCRNEGITATTRWLNDPQHRRSTFDLCAFNLLHYLPEGARYMQESLAQSFPPYFDRVVLRNCEVSISHFFHMIQQKRSMVIYFQDKLNSFAAPNGPHQKTPPSLDQIRMQQRNLKRDQFSEDRILQTTPENLARICDEIQSMMEKQGHGSNLSSSLQTAMELRDCLDMVCKDYLTKTFMLMDIERLQALNDLNVYDMYSCRFDNVEVPPPLGKVKGCPGCNKNYYEDYSAEFCRYHKFLSLDGRYNCMESFSYLEKIQGWNKPSIVRTPQQFILLEKCLKNSGGYNHEKEFVVHLTVPGIAENRPLVSIGDFVRFRFGNVEIIGDVREIQVKTERVMLFLPLPLKVNADCKPFTRALVTPKNRTDKDNTKPYKDQNKIQRFDVRFGLFGSRAHDIFKTTVNSAVVNSMDRAMRVIAPTPFLEKILKKSERRPQIGISNWSHENLNPEQKHAVFDIVRGNNGHAPYCIYGPPGTGKTVTIVESIVQILRYDGTKKILVCAPSDAACDVIAKRLLPVLPRSSEILRINWVSRNPASLPPVLLGCSPMDMSGFFMLPSPKRIQEVSVVICQCFVAGCLELELSQGPWIDKHFTHCFIDESSQSLEFESLIPLLKVGKDCSIVLAGDPKQLGPTVRSSCASSNGLSLSLQERLMGLSLYQEDSNYCVITKLLDNYRSHSALLSVPSQLFYDGSLRCKASAEISSACAGFELLRDGQNFPMMVYDVFDGKEKSKIDTPSFYNIEECYASVRIIEALLASPNVKIHAGQIAIITCFRAQVLKMREILRESQLSTVNVGVVEDFQGQEMSVVLVSTVLTENQRRWMKGTMCGLGFMLDPKRFNVAITRASSLCVIVGNVNYLENSGSYWTALIDHVRRNGGVSGDSRVEDGVEVDGFADYGIDAFIQKVEELNLLGAGHELDRYDLAMRGYYEDAPEWKVCL